MHGRAEEEPFPDQAGPAGVPEGAGEELPPLHGQAEAHVLLPAGADADSLQKVSLSGAFREVWVPTPRG